MPRTGPRLKRRVSGESPPPPEAHDIETDDELINPRAVLGHNSPPGGAGKGVDAAGGPVVDPTKNVEDLVRAGERTASIIRSADQRFLDAQLLSMEKLTNFAREAETKMQNYARDAEGRLNRALLDAETRRIDQLASTRQEFQNTIRDMLAESVRTTSTLVSTQLVQIQATFDTRVSKLEAAAFTQAGARAVADPQISEAISRLISSQTSLRADTEAAIARMAAANSEAQAKLTALITGIGSVGQKTVDTKAGQNLMAGWIAAAVMGLAALATPFIAYLALKGH